MGHGGIIETRTGVFVLTEYFEKHFGDLVLLTAQYNQQEITYQLRVNYDAGMNLDEFGPSSSKSYIINRVLVYCFEC